MKSLYYFILAIPFLSFAQESFNYDHEKIEVIKGEDVNVVMNPAVLYDEQWSQLPQPIFWKEIMTLSSDSCLINVASNRQVLLRMSIDKWHLQTELQKQSFKDSLRLVHGLSIDEAIYVTTGKNDFYLFDKVYPSLAKGVEAFENNGVDPWYAQAILLIESPGQLKKSSAGAYGAFQLMPAVARAQGLTVNRYVDERKDFNRSAYGASRLIKNICIPEAKRILDAHQINYSENDLWFRLFVLHVYHAGALNVASVVNKINPRQGGQSLICEMWQTTAGNFGNNSQNYSQLALASQLILNEMIQRNADAVLQCSIK